MCENWKTVYINFYSWYIPDRSQVTAKGSNEATNQQGKQLFYSAFFETSS
jgi:hypothetical protein